jgi:hypothetical protein
MEVAETMEENVKWHVFNCFRDAINGFNDEDIFPSSSIAVFVRLKGIHTSIEDLTIASDIDLFMTDKLQKDNGFYDVNNSKWMASIAARIEVKTAPNGSCGVVFTFLTDIDHVSISSYHINAALQIANSETKMLEFASKLVESNGLKYLAAQNGMVISNLDNIKHQAPQILENMFLASARAPWHVMRMAFS